MSTLRQIEANRRNAQKSTGPTSVTGKAASAMNSLKTGLHAKSLVLPFESAAELEHLTEECYRHFRPANLVERLYVDDIIRCEWSLRRLDNAETQTYRYQNEDRFRDEEKFPLGQSATCNANSFTKLQYRVDAPRRARDRALLSLERLQAKAQADRTPAPPPHGHPLPHPPVRPRSPPPRPRPPPPLSRTPPGQSPGRSHPRPPPASR